MRREIFLSKLDQKSQKLVLLKDQLCVIQSEVSQKEKSEYCIITHIYGI